MILLMINQSLDFQKSTTIVAAITSFEQPITHMDHSLRQPHLSGKIPRQSLNEGRFNQIPSNLF